MLTHRKPIIERSVAEEEDFILMTSVREMGDEPSNPFPPQPQTKVRVGITGKKNRRGKEEDLASRQHAHFISLKLTHVTFSSFSSWASSLLEKWTSFS